MATAWIGWVTGLSYCGINPTDSSFMDGGSTGGSGHLGFPFEDWYSLLLARYNCSSKIESLVHSSICLFLSSLNFVPSKPVLLDFPGGPVIKTLSVQCRGLGSLPGQGTRSRMLKLKILHATPKLLYAAKKIPSVEAKAWHSQINKNTFLKSSQKVVGFFLRKQKKKTPILLLALLMCQWSESHSVMFDSLWPHGLYSPWNSPGQNTWVGSPTTVFPSPGDFPHPGIEPGSLALQ